MGNTGFRVYLSVDRLPLDFIDQFKGIPTPNIGDCMGRFYAMKPSVKSYNKPGVNLVGSAITVKAAPGDNLMVHKAVDIAKPGDVIVISTGEDLSHSILGEILCIIAKQNGVRGFVLDGAIRDVYGIYQMDDFAVYAAGATPGGPYKNGPGEVNVPITCGGVTVNPGDVIVGDDDGIMVVPKDEAAEILEKSRKFFEKEQGIFEQLSKGKVDRSWVDELLTEGGCEIIE